MKKAIKEKKKPGFDDIAADTLYLWKVIHCTISHVVLLNSRRSPSIVPNGIQLLDDHINIIIVQLYL